MPLSMSQEDNVVDNRPLPTKTTGAEAVAAFRAGQTSAEKSKSTDTTTSASKDKDKDKKRRKSTAAPTSPPHSPAALPSPPPSGSGSGRKRKVTVVEPEKKEEDVNDDEDEDDTVSPLTAALADFAPASLTPLPPTTATQPLWLFQFPAKFDVAAFSALRLSLPTTATPAGAVGRIIGRFQLGSERYRIIEAEASETTDIVNLVPAPPAASQTANLTPARPFTRLLRITLDNQPNTASWPHTSAALKRKAAVPATRGLTVHFRPIGYMEDGSGQEVGERRGKGFQKVRYEGGEEEEKGVREKKRRKKEEKGKMVEREEVSEKKKKKKKDKHKHRDSK